MELRPVTDTEKVLSEEIRGRARDGETRWMTELDMKASSLDSERWQRVRPSKCMIRWSPLLTQYAKWKTLSMKWRWPSRANLKRLGMCIAGKNTTGFVLGRTYRDLNLLRAE